MRISDWSSDVCSSDLLLGSTAEMNFHLLAADPGPGGGPGGRVSPGVRLLPATDGAARYPVPAPIAVRGERLVDAQAAFDPHPRQQVVSFPFYAVRAPLFTSITPPKVRPPFPTMPDPQR